MISFASIFRQKTGKAPHSWVTAVALLLLLCLTGCERAVTGSEKATVLAFSEPTTDNLLEGLADDDYA